MGFELLLEPLFVSFELLLDLPFERALLFLELRNVPFERAFQLAPSQLEKASLFLELLLEELQGRE